MTAGAAAPRAAEQLRAAGSIRARVAVVATRPLLALGVRAVIEQAGEFVLADDTMRPDVVVSDDRTRATALADGGHGVVFLADDEGDAPAALEAGVRGYLTNTADDADLLRVVRAVARGDALFCAAAADQLVDRLTGEPAPAAQAFPQLTDRERDVLAGLADGSSNGQVAARLGLAPKTVRNHVSSICNKLRVLDRSQAILRAREAGLGLG